VGYWLGYFFKFYCCFEPRNLFSGTSIEIWFIADRFIDGLQLTPAVLIARASSIPVFWTAGQLAFHPGARRGHLGEWDIAIFPGGFCAALIAPDGMFIQPNPQANHWVPVGVASKTGLPRGLPVGAA